MREPRPGRRSHYSKQCWSSFLKWTAFMPVSKMALGCRCDASANSPKNSAGDYVRRPMPPLQLIWFVRPPVANCPCDEFLKIKRETRSDKLTFGNTDTTR